MRCDCHSSYGHMISFKVTRDPLSVPCNCAGDMPHGLLAPKIANLAISTHILRIQFTAIMTKWPTNFQTYLITHH